MAESVVGRLAATERRVHGAVAVGCFAVAVLAARGVEVGARLLLAWNVATVAWLALTWLFTMRSSATETREWARQRRYETARLDRTLAVAFSLFGLAFGFGLLTLARTPQDPIDHVEIGLSALAIVLAWLALNTEYAVHYATLYYGDRPPEAGLAFPGDDDPAHLDFAYFAFTVGTAISTSDVAITSRSFRMTALGHALLAFAYNTGILGLVVNFANLYA